MEIKRNVQQQFREEKETKAEGASLLQGAAVIRAGSRKSVVVLQCGIVPYGTVPGQPLPAGTKLFLEREPDNPVDRWATRVLTMDGRFLGYLPAAKNQSVARLIDAGKIIIAEIADIDAPEYQTALRTFDPKEDKRFGLTLKMDIYEKGGALQ